MTILDSPFTSSPFQKLAFFTGSAVFTTTGFGGGVGGGVTQPDSVTTAQKATNKRSLIVGFEEKKGAE